MEDFGISFIVVTYQRPDCLLKTANSLSRYMKRDDIEILICDDSSKGSQIDLLVHLEEMGCVVIRSDVNTGLAANVNRGLRAAKFPIICQLQDDFVLTDEEPESIVNLARQMVSEQISFLSLTKAVSTSPIASFGILGELDVIKYKNDLIPKKIVKFERPYSDQPHLKSRCFVKDLGLYLEGTSMVLMELEYKYRVSQQEKHSIWSLTKNFFEHIGEEQTFNPFNHRFSKGKTLINRLIWKLQLGWEIATKWK